jgi:hypothetical protein
MKRIITTFCVALVSANAIWAQGWYYEEEDWYQPSSSSVTLDGSLYDLAFAWRNKPRHIEAHWAGLSFAFSDLKGLPSDVIIAPERSYSISWNVEDVEVALSKHWLIASGLGFDWSRYHFEDASYVKQVDGKTDFYHYEDAPLKDSKLLVYYLKIPLLLEYQTGIGKRKFFIQGGVEGLIKLYSKSRIEIRENNKIRKEDFRNLKINPVNARLFLHLGIGSVGIFGYYQPMSLFRQNYGPDIQTVGFGIALN